MNKPFQIYLILFFGRSISSVDQGNTIVIEHLDISKGFDRPLNDILNKMVKYGLDDTVVK